MFSPEHLCSTTVFGHIFYLYQISKLHFSHIVILIIAIICAALISSHVFFTNKVISNLLLPVPHWLQPSLH